MRLRNEFTGVTGNRGRNNALKIANLLQPVVVLMGWGLEVYVSSKHLFIKIKLSEWQGTGLLAKWALYFLNIYSNTEISLTLYFNCLQCSDRNTCCLMHSGTFWVACGNSSLFCWYPPAELNWTNYFRRQFYYTCLQPLFIYKDSTGKRTWNSRIYEHFLKKTQLLQSHLNSSFLWLHLWIQLD